MRELCNGGIKGPILNIICWIVSLNNSVYKFNLLTLLLKLLLESQSHSIISLCGQSNGL